MWWSPYIGLPYNSYNCWGLVRKVYQEQLSIELPPFSEIDPKALRQVAIGIRAGVADWTAVASPAPLDVVLMRQHRLPVHVGIVTEPGWILHTERATDAVHVQAAHPTVVGRIVGHYRRIA